MTSTHRVSRTYEGQIWYEHVGKNLCIIRIFCRICFCVFSIYFGIFSLSTWTVNYLSIKSVYGILKGRKTCVYCILEFFEGGASLMKAFLVLLKNVFSYLYQQNSNCIIIQYFIHSQCCASKYFFIHKHLVLDAIDRGNWLEFFVSSPSIVFQE